MKSTPSLPAPGGRAERGFTLVELLVVIAIIGTLMALLIPAVGAVRAAARRSACESQQRQIALGIRTYVSSAKGAFPGYVVVERLLPAVDDQYPLTTGIRDIAIPWAAKMLPQLDNQGLWDQLLSNNSNNGFDGGKGVGSDDYDSPPRLEFFVCPDDAGTNALIGKLSYVINSGYWDDAASNPLNGNYQVDYPANGISFDQRRSNAPKIQSGGIKDGETQTLLLSENIHKDEQIGTSQYFATWMGPVDITTNPEQRFGMAWIDNPQAIVNNVIAQFGSEVNGQSDYSAAGPMYARPASSHPEVFIAAFADGHTRQIRNTIDYRVYQQLLTPNGAKAVNPANPNTPLPGYMNPPLSESDY